MNGNGYITVPGHAGLLLKAYAQEDGFVWLQYIGDADVLISVGIATAADIFAPRKNTGPRPRSTAPEQCHMDRYWAVRNEVFLRKQRQNALRMPGAVEPLRAHEAAERGAAVREAERVHRELTAALAKEREWEAAEPDDQVPAGRARPGSMTLH